MGFPIPIHWMSPLSFKGAPGVILDFYFLFFSMKFLSKQNSPRWEAAFCGVTSGAIYTVCQWPINRLGGISSKNEIKLKITPNTPKNES